MWEIIEGTRGEYGDRRHKDYGYSSKGPRMGYSSSRYKHYDEEEMEEMLEEAYECGYEEGLKKAEKHPSLSKFRDRPMDK